MNTLGLHLLIELGQCDPEILDNTGELRKILYRVSRESKMTPLKDSFHKFVPQGVSGVVLLAESHVSIHTWPELGYAAVDFFTCNTSTDMNSVVEAFVRTFNPGSYKSTILERGINTLSPLTSINFPNGDRAIS